MIEFFFNAAPNPLKVALFLEESGLEYRATPIDTKRGDQHKISYRQINPNAKVPAIRDGETIVFDSNAILLYLAEKTGKFMLKDAPNLRGVLLSWLMFIGTGVGPYSGQAFHFRNIAPSQGDVHPNSREVVCKIYYPKNICQMRDSNPRSLMRNKS